MARARDRKSVGPPLLDMEEELQGLGRPPLATSPNGSVAEGIPSHQRAGSLPSLFERVERITVPQLLLLQRAALR